MLKRLNPRAHFPVDAMELAKVMFTSDDHATAKELGVTIDEWMNWKTGVTPVPKVVWLYLSQKRDMTLPKRFGPWAGFKVDGPRLVSPWGDSVNFEELSQLPDYRRATDLAERQADLIERLMMERDFYKANCHRQARFGLMMNKLFKD